MFEDFLSWSYFPCKPPPKKKVTFFPATSLHPFCSLIDCQVETRIHSLRKKYSRVKKYNLFRCVAYAQIGDVVRNKDYFIK